MSMNNELPLEVSVALKGKRLEDVAVKVMYKNYKGEVGLRTIFPLQIYMGKNEYHSGEQWLMKVWDVDKNAYRDYALRDIQEWIFT